MHHSVFAWVGFNAYVLVMLALDLGVFHRKEHTISIREALVWTVIWIIQALIFDVGVWHFLGSEQALQFLTGYVIEKSLSVDNLFVFLLLFTYFNVKSHIQHKVLFWGIFGALIMRATLIALGATLIARFHWVMYIFGGFLVLTGIRMIFEAEPEVEPEKNPVVRLVRRLFPMTPDYHGSAFFVRIDGKRYATPLVVVVAVVEVTDLLFAVDSIPAIFSISTDAFIVYTSNVFAILGLRSLYFALAGIIDKFRFLNIGLALVLSFVGVKMLIVKWYEIPTWLALSTVALILSLAVAISVLLPEPEEEKEEDAASDPEEDAASDPE
ncbi:MAG: TerC family protein, partial [Deltaproteobacteria bacterium]|nr:TerC family protein [Deltaproteobacteria bacterium]